MPTKQDKTGEERMMSCGQIAKIIACRLYKDIDVQFEDGTIVRNTNYYLFKNGSIRHPDIEPPYARRTTRYKSLRIGETRKMNNGMSATIIDYKGQYDITVQFEDGTIISKTRYQAFIRGEILNPNIGYNRKKKNLREGTNRKMHNGMECEIIAYRGSDDIDVKFEDGAIVTHCKCTNFMNGNIAHPNAAPKNCGKKRVGLKKTMNNGMECEIIAYRGNMDIDVRFEDGTIVEHRGFQLFQKGGIRNPNIIAHRKT